MTITVSGPALVAETCTRRLAALLGSDIASVRRPTTFGSLGLATSMIELVDSATRPAPNIDCVINWHGPAVPADLPGSEAMIQARSGLAHLHGLDVGQPRRIGIEVASVAAGVLASQGVLAALIAGGGASAVRTSVTQAALLTISQYIARATASGSWSEWAAELPGPEPGPPFKSADHHWIEIETLSPAAWSQFWLELGVDPALLGRAWTMFNARYSTAKCTMPAGFHAATQSRPMADLAELARSFGLSLCRLRSYDEVLREPGIGPPELPLLTMGPAPTAHQLNLRAPTRVFTPAALEAGLPLAGIRVIEATSRIQGPLAGQLLRMMGADVLRVEPPGGDVNRMASPSAGDAGAFFLCVNRGKRSVELNLASGQGRRELRDLITDTDVFLHNWRTGRAEEWHLDFDSLAPRCDGLVYVAATGWGELAPKCPPIGMDFLVQAYAGLGNAIQPEGQPPWPTRLLLADVMGALVTCEGALTALYRRRLTGHSVRVETSLLAGAMSLQAHVLDAMASSRERGRRGGRPVWRTLDYPLPAADGHVLVTPPDEDGANRLARACGVRSAQASREQVAGAILNAIVARPAQEWERELLTAGIPCGAVTADLSKLANDPLLDACLERVGTAWMPASPWAFSGD